MTHFHLILIKAGLQMPNGTNQLDLVVTCIRATQHCHACNSVAEHRRRQDSSLQVQIAKLSSDRECVWTSSVQQPVPA